MLLGNRSRMLITAKSLNTSHPPLFAAAHFLFKDPNTIVLPFPRIKCCSLSSATFPLSSNSVWILNKLYSICLRSPSWPPLIYQSKLYKWVVINNEGTVSVTDWVTLLGQPPQGVLPKIVGFEKSSSTDFKPVIKCGYETWSLMEKDKVKWNASVGQENFAECVH